MIQRHALHHALLLVLVLAFLAGCQGAPRAVVPAKPHAECLVCKKNADLACVDVAVDEKTPRAEYGGKTYYFCSEECRVEFLKRPARYLEK
jgi:YHS domain-containing protein